MLNEEGAAGAQAPFDLRERTLQFSLRILRLSTSLPNTPEGRVVRGQLVRCGTSPGAQYREACRARSPAEFISKVESAQQELDETDYWLEMIGRAQMAPPVTVAALKDEVRELIAIFAASARTAKARR